MTAGGIPRRGAPLLQVLALPLLTTGKTTAAAATAHHFGYFPGPLRMPPGHNDEGVSAAGDADPEAAIRGSVASLMSLPIVKAFVGEEGGKWRELVEKGAVSAMGMAEKMRTHKYVKPAYEKMMDKVHSREEVLKAADDALAQAQAIHKKKKGKGRHAKHHADTTDDGTGSEEPAEGCVLEVELVYPEGVVAEKEGAEGVIREGWMEFVKASEGHHATWKGRSLAFLPVTALLSVLPAPNVLLLWNAFRVYSHLKSSRGAEGLAQGLLQHHYTLRPDPELGRIFHDHLHYQQQHHKDAHAHGSRHVDGKHATAPVMEERFEKALAAVGRRYQVDDLPRLYRRWKPLTASGEVELG